MWCALSQFVAVRVLRWLESYRKYSDYLKKYYNLVSYFVEFILLIKLGKHTGITSHKTAPENVKNIYIAHRKARFRENVHRVCFLLCCQNALSS